MADININVPHLTRVEGHGQLVVTVKNGQVETCRLDVVEAPRFFEAMLRGRDYAQASHIASRICGACAVGHVIASLRATENALGIEPSEQTVLLRKLNLHGETLHSHTRRVYMLAAPDLLGVPSVIPPVKAAPELAARALRLQKLGSDLCAAIAGRHTHPIALAAGGLTHLPGAVELKALRERLVDARADVDATVRFAKTLAWPAFERKTEYVALRQENEYAFIDGDITTTDGGSYSIHDYRQVTHEQVVQHSSAKHCQHKRKAYMVGALARFNVNYDRLHPAAQAAAKDLGLRPLCANPFLNTAAQVVEIVHCVEDAIRLIDELVVRGVRPEPLPPFPGRGGAGAGACETPDGLLIHQRQIDDEGRISGADCVSPSGQNQASFEADLRQLTLENLGQTPDKLRLMAEMLAHAYCFNFSCATH